MSSGSSGSERRALSIEEWADLPEDEPGELVDGYLQEEEMPGLLHEIVVAWLVHVLKSWVDSRGGLVFGSEGKFAISSRRGRKPDLAMYLPGHPALPRYGAVRVRPDVAVEIVTPTPRDGRYVRALGATEGMLAAVPGCDGLALALDELWREAEKLGPEQPEPSC